MKQTILTRTVLAVSGFVAATFGAIILLDPMAFYATYGIDLAGQTGLLNELRASGGSLLAIGLMILSGAFISRFAGYALLVSSLTFLSYAVSRGLAVLLDGMPGQGFILAAAIELAIGALCLGIIVKSRSGQNRRNGLRSANA